MEAKAEQILKFIRNHYNVESDFIPLHSPIFNGNEKKYLIDCIDSTYVSSVGEYVNKFESMMVEIIGAKFAIATNNGTSALHLSLLANNVNPGDIVITQSLSFVATANAIKYIGAIPMFVDVDINTMGMCYLSLKEVLNSVEIINNEAIYTKTGQRVSAIIPMHTFGRAAEIDKIVSLANKYKIPVIEDAAEALGSIYKDKALGSYGTVGVFSFNGNKIVTSGGGGMIVTNDEQIAKKMKHLSTQSKVNHPWKYEHDQIGFNYRCPNLNAALACAQLEQLNEFIESKRQTANKYLEFFKTIGIKFSVESKYEKTNYWLNSILFNSIEERDFFLSYSNKNGVMTRPTWNLLHTLPQFKDAIVTNISNSVYLSERLVNIPSSAK